MKVSIINNIEEFKSLQSQWNDLYIKASKTTVFQSFDFNFFSWKNELAYIPNNKLAIVLVSDKTSLLAIFPFYINKNKELRFLNDIHADFCDFICDGVVDFFSVYKYLLEQLDFYSMKFINIQGNSNIYTYHRDVSLKNKIIKPYSNYSFLKVDKGDFPYNVSYYRSAQKYRINKAYRKHELKLHDILEYRTRSFPKEDIIYLIHKMVDSGRRKQGFFNDHRLLLIENLYNSGIIVISVMRDSKQVYGLNFILKESSKRYMFWIDLFTEAKLINIANYVNFIKKMSLNNKLDMNFGRGLYQYKISNFAPKEDKLFMIAIFDNKWRKLRFSIYEQLKYIARLIYKR